MRRLIVLSVVLGVLSALVVIVQAVLLAGILAEVIIGWRLLVNAKVALAAQAGAAERDRPFYAGKVAAARFFAREVLPAITASRKIIEGGDLGLMELSDDAW